MKRESVHFYSDSMISIPMRCMMRIASRSLVPLLVSKYSTFNGYPAKVVLEINPESLSSFSCSINIFWVIPFMDVSREESDMGPFFSVHKRIGFHFPLITSWVTSRGQVICFRIFIGRFICTSVMQPKASQTAVYSCKI